MSTNYGTIIERNGQPITVEAYGIIHTIRLERDGVEIAAFDNPDEIDNLIAVLELAKGHCWESA